MDNRRYMAFKLNHQCPTCEEKHDGEHIYCDRCLDTRRNKYRKTIYCIDCGVEIPCTGGGARTKICKNCLPSHRTEYIRQWHNALSPEEKQRQKELSTARMRERRKNRPIAHFASGILRRYGLSLEQFNDLYAKQNGRCAICKNELPTLSSPGSDRKNMHIDHNHTTNLVRGILCLKCNVGISLFEENPEILMSAIEYVTSK